MEILTHFKYIVKYSSLFLLRMFQKKRKKAPAAPIPRSLSFCRTSWKCRTKRKRRPMEAPSQKRKCLAPNRTSSIWPSWKPIGRTHPKSMNVEDWDCRPWLKNGGCYWANGTIEAGEHLWNLWKPFTKFHTGVPGHLIQFSQTIIDLNMGKKQGPIPSGELT